MFTYIVSGFPRSGTSMVMQALEAGGIELVYSELRDKQMNEAMSDKEYKANPKSLYETPVPLQASPGFPLPYTGKALKVLLPPFGTATTLELGIYVVIIMKRDPEEVRQSFEAFFMPRGGKWPFQNRDHYNTLFESGVKLLKLRNDTKVLVWNYKNVISQPLKHFKQVWNIDAKAAASIVDPELYRFQLKKLTKGA